MLFENSIISIGGVGGSGTRVVAQIFNELGYHIGEDLNTANDNLLFTLLFKYRSILTKDDEEFKTLYRIFKKILQGSLPLTPKELEITQSLATCSRPPQHTEQFLKERLKKISHKPKKENKFAFKEPNTHIVIERLFKLEKNLKYVYVYRNGLDMAYSKNQNQLKLWGDIFLDEQNCKIDERNSLKYWCITHRRLLKLKETYPNRIYMLDFDKLCKYPQDSITDMLEFFGLDDKKQIDRLTNLVKLPSSTGRYKKFSLENFDKEDLKFINSIYL